MLSNNHLFHTLNTYNNYKHEQEYKFVFIIIISQSFVYTA